MDEEQGEDYWKPKIVELRKQYDALIQCTDEFCDAGLMTQDEMGRCLGAYNTIMIDQSGSKRLEYDAVHYALARHGMHAYRQLLLQLHPELEQELSKRLDPERWR